MLNDPVNATNFTTTYVAVVVVGVGRGDPVGEAGRDPPRAVICPCHAGGLWRVGPVFLQAADSLGAQAESLGEAPATEPIAEAAFDPGTTDDDEDLEEETAVAAA